LNDHQQDADGGDSETGDELNEEEFLNPQGDEGEGTLALPGHAVLAMILMSGLTTTQNHGYLFHAHDAHQEEEE
jgi:hypothetical protein